MLKGYFSTLTPCVCGGVAVSQLPVTASPAPVPRPGPAPEYRHEVWIPQKSFTQAVGAETSQPLPAQCPALTCSSPALVVAGVSSAPGLEPLTCPLPTCTHPQGGPCVPVPCG